MPGKYKGKFKRRCDICSRPSFITLQMLQPGHCYDRINDRWIMLPIDSKICKVCHEHNPRLECLPLPVSSKQKKCSRCNGEGLIANPIPIGIVPTPSIRRKHARSSCPRCHGTKKEAV